MPASFPWLDLIVVAVVLISALLAMVRGLTREVLSIAAWVAAAAAALLLYQHVLPFLTPYIKNATLALLASGALVFIVVLIIVSFFTIRISDAILDSRIGALDRTLGFVFGAARGLLLAVVAYLFFGWLVPAEKRPEWVRNAQTRPALDSGATYLLSVMPADPEEMIRKRLQQEPGTPAPEGAPDQAGTAPTPPTAQPSPSATP